MNQPADISFVISRLLGANVDPTTHLSGMIDPTRIAVAGHSDGGETALAVAYARDVHDPRVDAAVTLSGAEFPGVGGFTFPPGSPPLLATQGTSDAINPPRYTREFYRAASRPKFLLSLQGAAHLPPYTSEQPQLAIVERVTIAFLDVHFQHGSLQRLLSAGSAPGARQADGKPLGTSSLEIQFVAAGFAWKPA